MPKLNPLLLLLLSLINNGFIESSEEDSDIYIINTCTVTNTSDNKSLKMIRQERNNNKDSIVIAVGCMAQVNSDLLKNIDVNIILGNSGKSDIVKYIESLNKKRMLVEDIQDIIK